MKNDPLIYEWCPKLQICYEESCKEINTIPQKNYTDYAIYPKYISDYVEIQLKRNHHNKSIDFCFMGAFAFNRIQKEGYTNRLWVIDFAKSFFTKSSLFVNTTKNKGLDNSWNVLGEFDYTFNENFDFKAPKFMKNKNYFDKKYYEYMSNSKFCLCPAGDLMWSMRFYEALLCRCIPIINIVDESYRNELESKIPYKYYLSTEENFEYRLDWVNHNLELFYKYHSFHTHTSCK